LPGPRAKAIIDRDHHSISQNYIKDYPLVVDHAEGMVVTDVDGNRFLDFTAGIAVSWTWIDVGYRFGQRPANPGAGPRRGGEDPV
jgi:4-aminobutyrate aminotransferase-like enzyme